MEKQSAVASLGQTTLLLPAWIKAALQANDRLKLYLSILQSAEQHALSPTTTPVDWTRDIAHLGLNEARWLKELSSTAYREQQMLIVPDLQLWLDALEADLRIMARPVCDVAERSDVELGSRRDRWLGRIEALKEEEGLSPQALEELTHGDRRGGDSFHLLVMDLHKKLNGMAVEVATEDVDGAHVWQVDEKDRPLIQAFMRGLGRTSALKFNHPGLDTAVTRNGKRLLIQNDIGTNDAHVLVIEVEKRTVQLTYSDLHPPRFEFFRAMLADYGFDWTVFDPRTTEGMNQGKPYQVGNAVFAAANDDSLLQVLDFLGSRIVFVIDWNRARKRLQAFVRKPLALEVLRYAADNDLGHMAWLLAGGEHLVYEAMQSVDGEAFRIGERLDQVLGEAETQNFLQGLLRIASVKLREQQPVALIADEVRLLLARALQKRTYEYDLLAEHAAFCHALALGLSEVLEFATLSTDAVQRAKGWERKADHLLMEARKKAERQPRWIPMVQLLDDMDDVADALEEAIFIHSMTLSTPGALLPPSISSILSELTDTTLAAIQDQIKAIEIARHLSEQTDPLDSEAFLQALWRMLRAERICDDLLRKARIRITQELHASPAAFSLATELACTIENATDSLLTAGYALRKLVFNKTGMSV